MSVIMLNVVAPQELLIGLFTLKIREKFSKQFYFSNLKDAVVSWAVGHQILLVL
jgi:hypothetical protein